MTESCKGQIGSVCCAPNIAVVTCTAACSLLVWSVCLMLYAGVVQVLQMPLNPGAQDQRRYLF